MGLINREIISIKGKLLSLMKTKIEIIVGLTSWNRTSPGKHRWKHLPGYTTQDWSDRYVTLVHE